MRLRLALAGCFVLPALAGAGATEVTVHPARPAPGEVFLVEVDAVPAGVVPELHSTAENFRMWPVDSDTWAGLAAVDRDESAERLSLRVVDGESVLRELDIPLDARTYPEQHLTVSDRMVHLSPEDQQRAARENRLIRSTLTRRSQTRLWSAPFTRPVEGPVTSPFGVRRVYNGTPRSYHSGLDIAAPRGTPVRTSSDGRVALVGDFFYTGNTVLLDHGLGLYSAYFHLDTVEVSAGEAVTANTAVGTVGSTGRSTGPHLHWGIYLAGVKADPLSLVQVLGVGAGGGESP